MRRKQRASKGQDSGRSKSTAKKTRVAKRYTPSQRAEILEYADREGVTKASEKHGVSRFAIYNWRHKVEMAAKGQGDSPTSGPDPTDIEA